MYEEIEIVENETEETTELATCEEPVEEQSGVGFKGVLAGAALIGATIWGVNKLRKKVGNKEQRKARKLEKAMKACADAGYIVVLESDFFTPHTVIEEPEDVEVEAE